MNKPVLAIILLLSFALHTVGQNQVFHAVNLVESEGVGLFHGVPAWAINGDTNLSWITDEMLSTSETKNRTIRFLYQTDPMLSVLDTLFEIPLDTIAQVSFMHDINHDGTLSQDDLVYQGNADPYLYGGLQNTFHYKNLKFGVYVNYSLGGKIYNYSEIYMAGSIFTNQYRYMLNAWHPERNPESDIPRAGGKTDAALPSDFMIHDASYLRIKNVSLSYVLPFKRTSKLRDMTFSLIGENLYLWKNYNGFDPDVSSEGTSSTLRRVDLGAYPKSRTVTFSIQVRY